MVRFKPFKHKGDIYSLEHLNGFAFQKNDLTIEVDFSSHCFTEKWDEKSDYSLRYTFASEVRGFSFERYQLSKRLPDYFITLSEVYHNKNGNFFFWRNAATKQPYLVFFTLFKSTKKDIDLRLIVNSAHIKENMVLSGAPIKFETLAQKIYHKQPLKIGEMQRIKRK